MLIPLVKPKCHQKGDVELWTKYGILTSHLKLKREVSMHSYSIQIMWRLF